MTRSKRIAAATFLTLAMLIGLGSQSDAAQCGSGPGGFEAWKQQFAAQARAKGVGASAVSALMATNYASATIAADRGQRSFSLSLDQFLAKRGASSIVARGPGKSFAVPSCSTCVPPIEQLYLRLAKRVWIARRSSALPAKST